MFNLVVGLREVDPSNTYHLTLGQTSIAKNHKKIGLGASQAAAQAKGIKAKVKKNEWNWDLELVPRLQGLTVIVHPYFFFDNEYNVNN